VRKKTRCFDSGSGSSGLIGVDAEMTELLSSLGEVLGVVAGCLPGVVGLGGVFTLVQACAACERQAWFSG
jgi:hypothetical protein